ncbi:hypothetical protein [Thiobacillus sedimenti]|uniref:Lipoprotein n=1 Tax=Thiobacillus sedimenti TaxID=3110231 RepID=A0ABZ1CM08_9PROT|nr:hypothetical protein [Thiobacillus sp. SCUT-2]WRS38988.1 hypothetical protein VA613_13400 [Thiobacillus sp. SCUT-2]
MHGVEPRHCRACATGTRGAAIHCDRGLAMNRASIRVGLLCGLLMMLGMGLSACATGLLGRDRWKEEALQYDGNTVVVERSQSYGGRGEIGQGTPISEYRLAFALPGSGQTIEWESEYSQDVGRGNLHLLALHVLKGTPYVITEDIIWSDVSQHWTTGYNVQQLNPDGSLDFRVGGGVAINTVFSGASALGGGWTYQFSVSGGVF